MHTHTAIDIETQTATGPIGPSTAPEAAMHATPATQLTTQSQSQTQTRSTAMTDITTTSKIVNATSTTPTVHRRSRKLIAFDHAQRELKWAFAVKHSGKVLDDPAAQALATIEGWIVQVKVHHRGAIGLRWSTKTWPKALHKALKGHTALAMRLHCMEYPGVGSTATLEGAAAARFDAELRTEGEMSVLHLLIDARDRYDRAVWKYVKVRGYGRCVVPVRKRAPKTTPVVAEAPTPTPLLASEHEHVPEPPVGPLCRSDLRQEVAHAL